MVFQVTQLSVASIGELPTTRQTPPSEQEQAGVCERRCVCDGLAILQLPLTLDQINTPLFSAAPELTTNSKRYDKPVIAIPFDTGIDS